MDASKIAQMMDGKGVWGETVNVAVGTFQGPTRYSALSLKPSRRRRKSCGLSIPFIPSVLTTEGS